MASTKLKDLVVKVGSYTDRNSGQEKNRWETIGAIMQSDDGSMFVMLRRTFNPAGVPGQDQRESILVSAFDPQPKNGGQRQDDDGYSPQARTADRAQRPDGYGGGGRPDLDDEIPFIMEWR